MTELLGASDVAILLGVSRAAVSNYRKRGQLVPAEIIGGRPAYARSDVIALTRKRSGGARPVVRADDGRLHPRRVRRAEPARRAGSWMPQVETRPWTRLPTLDEQERAMR